MTNEYDPAEVLKKLMKDWKHIRNINQPRIVRLVPYAKKECQYIIAVYEQPPCYYEAQVFYKDKHVGKPIPSTDYDGIIRYIMEEDKTFFDDLIEKAKHAVDQVTIS